MERRTFWRAMVAVALGGTAMIGDGQVRPIRISIRAAKFEFAPAEVRVVRGRPVQLVLAAADFPHGFSLPDFNLRADLVPGREVHVTFTPDKVGRFHMLCDNFCGDGHDRMSGWFVVADA